MRVNGLASSSRKRIQKASTTTHMRDALCISVEGADAPHLHPAFNVSFVPSVPVSTKGPSQFLHSFTGRTAPNTTVGHDGPLTVLGRAGASVAAVHRRLQVIFSLEQSCTRGSGRSKRRAQTTHGHLVSVRRSEIVPQFVRQNIHVPVKGAADVALYFCGGKGSHFGDHREPVLGIAKRRSLRGPAPNVSA